MMAAGFFCNSAPLFHLLCGFPSVMPELEKLRQDIDAIDDAMQDLLLRRAALGREVARSKESEAGEGEGRATPLRPEREASILRRLARRHNGDLPLDSLFRIWREVMSSNLQLQVGGRFSVLLWQGDAAPDPDLWNLARDFCGSAMAVRSERDARVILERVGGNPFLLGMLPLPDGSEAGKWWLDLAQRRGGEGGALSVVGCLPFLLPSAAALPRILVLACAPFAPSGEDTSLFAWNCSGTDEDAAARARAALGQGVRVLDRDGQRMLLAVGGYMDGSEASLGALGGLQSLGGYANPWRERETGESAL